MNQTAYRSDIVGQEVRYREYDLGKTDDIDNFDESNLPSNEFIEGDEFGHGFQYAPGDNFIGYNMQVNETDGGAEFVQQMSLLRNGSQINVEVSISYEDGIFSTNFTDLDTGRVRSDSMSTDVSSSDVGKWQTLTKDPTDVDVQASHRQVSDDEWNVSRVDWKVQIYIPENQIYLSSYVNMTTYNWTTTFFYEGEELGRGTWIFGKNQTNTTGG